MEKEKLKCQKKGFSSKSSCSQKQWIFLFCKFYGVETNINSSRGRKKGEKAVEQGSLLRFEFSSNFLWNGRLKHEKIYFSFRRFCVAYFAGVTQTKICTKVCKSSVLNGQFFNEIITPNPHIQRILFPSFTPSFLLFQKPLSNKTASTNGSTKIGWFIAPSGECQTHLYALINSSCGLFLENRQKWSLKNKNRHYPLNETQFWHKCKQKRHKIQMENLCKCLTSDEQRFTALFFQCNNIDFAASRLQTKRDKKHSAMFRKEKKKFKNEHRLRLLLCSIKNSFCK